MPFDQLTDLKNGFWEIVRRLSLVLFNLSVALQVWVVTKIYSHDAAISSEIQWRKEHVDSAEEYKERIRKLEENVTVFKVSQETTRSDVRQVDQSVRNVAAALDVQSRQMANQQEKIAELREKTANVLVLLDSAINGKDKK